MESVTLHFIVSWTDLIFRFIIWREKIEPAEAILLYLTSHYTQNKVDAKNSLGDKESVYYYTYIHIDVSHHSST